MAYRRQKKYTAAKIAAVLLVTFIVIIADLYFCGLIAFKGPSKYLGDALKENFVLSKISQLYSADLNTDFTTSEVLSTPEPTAVAAELSEAGSSNQEEGAKPEQPVIEEECTNVDAYGLIDEDGDGVILDSIYYHGSTVYFLTVLDPSRIFVGSCVNSPDEYSGGKTLDVLCEEFDAIGGINAGGFMDDSGTGSGWPPEGIVYSQGECYWPEMYGPSALLDENGRLYVGYFSYEECEAMGIRDAVSFGPVLITDGEKADPTSLESGINPRTAIGQRADGAIVLMVADGRQAYSIGVSYSDCAEIMYDRGCINAVCMDGGNSSCMFWQGEQVNVSTNQAGGTRYLPDAWLIRR